MCVRCAAAWSGLSTRDVFATSPAAALRIVASIPTEANTLQDDMDDDLIGDVCDNCLFEANTDQADLDSDMQGDVCDLDDGFILVGLPSPSQVTYQEEAGFTSFNIYRGGLSVFLMTGKYTQDPLAVPEAAQFCGETGGTLVELFSPTAGEIVYYLATGFDGLVETDLGTDSLGAIRPNDNPCTP